MSKKSCKKENGGGVTYPIEDKKEKSIEWELQEEIDRFAGIQEKLELALAKEKWDKESRESEVKKMAMRIKTMEFEIGKTKEKLRDVKLLYFIIGVVTASVIRIAVEIFSNS